MFRQLTPSFPQLHASIHPMQIFLQLQHWLGQPFVQPQVVISLQDCGICGRERSYGTSWPSECIHPISVTGEDQDAVSGPGSKHFVVGTHDVEFMLHQMLEADSLVLYQYKTTWLVLCCMYQPQECHTSYRWISLPIPLCFQWDIPSQVQLDPSCFLALATKLGYTITTSDSVKCKCVYLISRKHLTDGMYWEILWFFRCPSFHVQTCASDFVIMCQK